MRQHDPRVEIMRDEFCERLMPIYVQAYEERIGEEPSGLTRARAYAAFARIFRTIDQYAYEDGLERAREL